MTIDNDLNIELTSPVYFARDAMCHIPFPQHVNSKSITKVNFITGVDRDIFNGALLYRLQWKDDASTSTQLLVIWGYRPVMFYSHMLYSHAWLIEHENTLVWDKDKLKMLYEKYGDYWYKDYNLAIWLLNDNTELQTYCEVSYGGYGMEMTISEYEGILFPVKPLWVDPSR
jgi:hypothetical protein